mmetsp:Transcript_29158/g.56243  ORF Transcript_29158/g.56243 Transcript_29158/m.56243 type:complete len:90 (+) Transcript_29158:372-641(+)
MGWRAPLGGRASGLLETAAHVRRGKAARASGRSILRLRQRILAARGAHQSQIHAERIYFQNLTPKLPFPGMGIPTRRSAAAARQFNPKW